LVASLPPGVKLDARNAYAKAVARMERGDPAAAAEAVRAAVALDPQFTTARLELASDDERARRYDEAIAQYRAILGYNANNPIALNNLAYGLAVQKNRPEEALPFAERAAALNPKDWTTLDTIAWVHHLLGRQNDAMRSIAAAVTASPAPQNAEVYWHAAAIFLDAGDRTRALQMMQTALAMDPSIADRADVKDVRRRLGGQD
jgi:tetratricopeptide (TPR) repeat protein